MDSPQTIDRDIVIHCCSGIDYLLLIVRFTANGEYVIKLQYKLKPTNISSIAFSVGSRRYTVTPETCYIVPCDNKSQYKRRIVNIDREDMVYVIYLTINGAGRDNLSTMVHSDKPVTASDGTCFLSESNILVSESSIRQ